MGHKDTRMLERVYGRQTPDRLALVMARAMGQRECRGGGYLPGGGAG